MARHDQLLDRDAVAHKELARPVAQDDQSIHIVHEGTEGGMLTSYQLSHTQAGPWSTCQAKAAKEPSDFNWQGPEH
jgi:hypothetical protein